MIDPFSHIIEAFRYLLYFYTVIFFDCKLLPEIIFLQIFHRIYNLIYRYHDRFCNFIDQKYKNKQHCHCQQQPEYDLFSDCSLIFTQRLAQYDFPAAPGICNGFLTDPFRL